MADAQSQKAQTGNRVKIKCSGLDVGYARTTQKMQDYGTEGLYCLGQTGPVEHDMQRWSGQITLDQFVISQKALGQAAQMMNLVPMGPDEVAEQGVLDFEVLDDQENVIVVYERCTPTNWSYNTQAGAFSGQNATFQALNVRREAHANLATVNGGVAQ